MTEYTMAPATESFAADDAGKRRKLMIVAGGVAGAVVLGGAGFLLLSGGGSEEEAFVLPTHRAPKAVTAKAPTLKSKVPTTSKLPTASSIRIGRDPFRALYLAPEAGSGAAPGAGGSGETTQTGGSASDPAANAPYVITLTKVTSDPGGAKFFTFVIGKETKVVLPAQRFGKYGELVVLAYVKNSKGAISGAVLQVGDDNPITVLIGAKTSVQ